MELLCIASYLHHGYEFHLYVYNPIEGIPEGTTVKDANEIMPFIGEQFGHIAQFADWWRYNLIYQKGGWWVDMDTVCLQSFDDLTYEHVLEGYVKAPAGSPVMAWVIEQCKRENWLTMSYGRIGPDLYKRAHEQFDFPFYTWPDTLHSFRDDEWRAYIEVPAREIPEGAHAAHLFHGMWRGAGMNVDAEYPPDSLYEIFKRRFIRAL
jgi:hypothetical protein